MSTSSATTPSWSIHLMKASDLNTVLSLQHQCYAPDFHEPVEAFASKLSAAPTSCWVVKGPDAVIHAYLICLPIQGHDYPALHATRWLPPQHPTSLYLHDMAVAISGRNQGIAPALLATARDWALARHMQQISLIAVQNSAPYWQRHGFVAQRNPPDPLARKLASFGPDATLMAHAMSA